MPYLVAMVVNHLRKDYRSRGVSENKQRAFERALDVSRLSGYDCVVMDRNTSEIVGVVRGKSITYRSPLGFQTSLKFKSLIADIRNDIKSRSKTQNGTDFKWFKLFSVGDSQYLNVYFGEKDFAQFDLETHPYFKDGRLLDLLTNLIILCQSQINEVDLSRIDCHFSAIDGELNFWYGQSKTEPGCYDVSIS